MQTNSNLPYPISAVFLCVIAFAKEFQLGDINIIEQMHQNKYNYLADLGGEYFCNCKSFGWKRLLFLFLLRILTCQVARITGSWKRNAWFHGAMRKC